MSKILAALLGEERRLPFVRIVRDVRFRELGEIVLEKLGRKLQKFLNLR